MNYIKKITTKQIVYVVLIIMWMGTIFMFSNQPSETSSKTSGGITEKVVKVITKERKNMPQKEVNKIETIVRKTAHFSIYAIGGILVAGLINTTKVSTKIIIIYTILFTVLYACTDEIHQLFVEGRSCEIRDIFIDGLGATLGTMIFLLTKKIRGK